MSSFNRRTLLLALAALPACGFTPAFGPNSGAAALLGNVEIEAPTDQNGFTLVRQLEQRLGRSEAAKYRLTWDLTTSQDGIAVTARQEITRFEVLGELGYALTDQTTGALVTSGSVRNFTGYSATGTTVAARTDNLDANRRLMIILADAVVTRLSGVK